MIVQDGLDRLCFRLAPRYLGSNSTCRSRKLAPIPTVYGSMSAPYDMQLPLSTASTEIYRVGGLRRSAVVRATRSSRLLHERPPRLHGRIIQNVLEREQEGGCQHRLRDLRTNP